MEKNGLQEYSTFIWKNKQKQNRNEADGYQSQHQRYRTSSYFWDYQL